MINYINNILTVAILWLTIMVSTTSCYASNTDVIFGGYLDTVFVTACIIESSSSLRGDASYYSRRFHGKHTANGEVFDENAFTAASVTLKFGTKLKVTNIDNGKSVIVIINDRGPYAVNKKGRAIRPLRRHPTRRIDLSKKSFAQIADLREGVITVKIEVLK